MGRKVQHMVSGVVLLAIDACVPVWAGQCLLALAIIAFYRLNQWQCTDPKGREWMLRLFGTLFREHEVNGHLPGAFYFLCGVFWVDMIHSHSLAIASVLFLTFGDPIASCVGQTTRSTCLYIPIANKSLLGTAAMLGSCICISGFLCSLDSNYEFYILLVGSLAATVAELYGSQTTGVDDNLLIPVLSCAAMEWLSFAKQ